MCGIALKITLIFLMYNKNVEINNNLNLKVASYVFP